MANLVPENVRKLLSTYKFDVDPDCITEDLKCTICKNLLNDAYQTFCDCKYCHQCIVAYMNDGNEYCPGGKEECWEERLVIDRTVFSNSVSNKKVLKIRVCCPNDSCQFTSILTQMEDHLRVCSHQAIKCPYTMIGCANARVNRDSVDTHLNKDTLAHTQMLLEVVDNLKNEVGGLKEEFRAIKLEIASFKEDYKLKERDIQEERNITQVEREAVNAVMEELKEEVGALRGQIECLDENQQRLTELMEDVTELREKIENNIKESRKMNDEVVSMKKAINIERERIERGFDIKAEMDALKMEIGTEREKSRKKRVLQGDLKRIDGTAMILKKDSYKEVAASIIDGTVDKLEGAVDNLGMRINKEVVVGKLWFKVSRFDAFRKRRETIFSPHLYSHVNGYKLRIQVGTSSGGWLCVSSIICNGEFDNVLSWPTRGLSVSVSLINHRTKEAYKTVTIKYDDRCCNKPIDKDNKSFGWTRLAYLCDLDFITGLIFSDSVILFVNARPP